MQGGFFVSKGLKMITDIVANIANHGVDAQVTVGANTPAPYGNAKVKGFIDGTNPSNATQAMAEFFNRRQFAAQYIIEAAGLVFDPQNWAQEAQAIAAISKAVGFSGNYNDLSHKPDYSTVYAPVAGDSGQTFGVAPATSSGQAVQRGQFTSSLTLPGWERSVDGRVFQWGTVITGPNGVADAAFPITFTNNVYCIFIGSFNTGAILATYQSTSPSGAAFQTWRAAEGSAIGNCAVSYLAIGV